MFKTEQIHNKIKDGYKYWKIVNADGEGMEIQLRDIAPEQSFAKFSEFCKNVESGNFAVIMYQKSPYTTAGTLKRDLPSIKLPFRIVAEQKEMQAANPMQTLSGFENLGGPFSASALYLENKELKKEIERLKEIIFDLKTDQRIKGLEDEHAAKIAEKENAWEERIMGIASTVAPDLLKSFNPRPISGVDEPAKNEAQCAKSKILTSVNKLIEKDPNFIENIEKLARLAEKNPTMYQQAAKLINSFI